MITLQARRPGQVAWSTRNAFNDENKLVIAGQMSTADLVAHAYDAARQWRNTRPDDDCELRVHDSEADRRMAIASHPAPINDANTRFALPIVDPFKGDVVSAETLYNRACEALGYRVSDHIGDLILDNFDYSAGPRDDNALCAAVYAWADGVRAQLSL